MARIRQATAADHAAWLAMRNALFDTVDDDFQQDEMALYLAADDKVGLFAVDDEDNALGFTELSLRNIVDGCLTSPVGFIEALYVKPETRGLGVGRQLVEASIAWLRGKGCTEFATDALLEDEEAQAFHRRMGFEETYRVVQFKLKSD